ncbi:MAG: hypothetical protein QW478_07355 [Candidatus Micrarchaeaceae archaeon]
MSKKIDERRDWKMYMNNSLGEVLPYLGFRENGYGLLDEINCGKKGFQYKFSPSLMRLLIIRKKFVDYRGIKGRMKKLFHIDLILRCPDFSYRT